MFVELKIARATASVTVERPLLRCRFRAGYLVRERGWRGGRQVARAAQPRVARQRQLGHSGPAPAAHQLCTRSLPDTRFSITSIFNWASRSWKMYLNRHVLRELYLNCVTYNGADFTNYCKMFCTKYTAYVATVRSYNFADYVYKYSIFPTSKVFLLNLRIYCRVY